MAVLFLLGEGKEREEGGDYRGDEGKGLKGKPLKRVLRENEPKRGVKHHSNRRAKSIKMRAGQIERQEETGRERG